MQTNMIIKIKSLSKFLITNNFLKTARDCISVFSVIAWHLLLSLNIKKKRSETGKSKKIKIKILLQSKIHNLLITETLTFIVVHTEKGRGSGELASVSHKCSCVTQGRSLHSSAPPKRGALFRVKNQIPQLLTQFDVLHVCKTRSMRRMQKVKSLC